MASSPGPGVGVGGSSESLFHLGTSSFFSDEVNRVRFTKIGSAMSHPPC